jgi:hypothetical protein
MEEDLTTAVTARKRPGVVTFVGIVLFIQAFASAVYGLVALLERNNERLQVVTGQDSDALVIQAIVQLVVAALLFFVASSIMTGTNWGRLLVAIVAAIQIVSLTWILITHHAGGFQTLGIVYIGIDIFVLWALYGHKESQEFYEGDLLS